MDDNPTHAELAVRLLRDAATFFDNVGLQNPGLQAQMRDNAEVYRMIADRLAEDPNARVRTRLDGDNVQ